MKAWNCDFTFSISLWRTVRCCRLQQVFSSPKGHFWFWRLRRLVFIGNICTARPLRGALLNANSDPLKLVLSVVIQTYWCMMNGATVFTPPRNRDSDSSFIENEKVQKLTGKISRVCSCLKVSSVEPPYSHPSFFLLLGSSTFVDNG